MSSEALGACPTVSIILPTFNRLKFLRMSIESVFAQTWRDWELLIADDGSAEETRAYLRTLEDPPRVTVLWLAHSGNPPAVRNCALRVARGEYVAFIDSDDVWAREKLSVQVAALRAPAARPWNYTGFTRIDATGSPLPASRVRRCPPIQGQFLEPLLKGEPLIVQSSVAVRRALLQEVGGYDEELPICGDYALWIRLAEQHEIDFIDAPLVAVRRHAEHYSDDIAGLEDLRKMMEKLRHPGVPRHLDAILRARRAKAAAGIATGHALGGRRLRVLGTLFSSARYSWQFPAWWYGALSATARAFAPPRVLDFVRKYRRAAPEVPGRDAHRR